MQYRLVALDLDGTLLYRQQISPRNREAIRAARERGITSVIATGRTRHSALVFGQQIGGVPIVCCNGAALLDERGEYILTRPLPVAPLQRLLEITAAYHFLVELYTPDAILVERPLAHVQSYMRWVRPQFSLWRAFRSLLRLWRLNRMHFVTNLLARAQKGQLPPVLKVMIIGEAEVLKRAGEQIRRAAPGLEVSSSGPDNLEVTAAGVTKASTLALLAARLKVPREAVVAIGDSDNDLAMFHYVGLSVAMGNAPDHVKAAAGRVTARNDEDGVAQVIESL